MAFVRHRGKVKTIHLKKQASTAFSIGDIVAVSDTGSTSDVVIPATSTTAATQHIGVINKAVTSSDDDYADKSRVPVLVPLEKNVEWKAPCGGSAASEDFGNEVDLTDASTINEAAKSVKVAKIVEVLDSTNVSVILKLNGSY